MAENDTYVIVVEDECDLTPFLEAFLQGEGYEVLCCVQYGQVLEEVRRRPPDLIIIVMQRPGLQESQKAVELLANDPTSAFVPVIALSTLPEILRQAQRNPNVKVAIREPFDLEDFLSHIRRLAAGPQAPPP